MAIPQKPPIAGMEADDLIRSMASLEGRLGDAIQRYLSWDEVRHRIGRGGHAEKVWEAIEMVRRHSARPMPSLLTLDGRPFRLWWSHEAIQEDLQRVTALARDPLDAIRPEVPPALAQEYERETVMEEALYSSVLEGANTTRHRAMAMLRRGTPPRTEGDRMVLNNYRTLEAIETHRAEPLSRGLIETLHRTITSGTLDRPEDEGRIQAPGDERICVVENASEEVVHTPPPAEELPRRIEALCEFANSEKPFLQDLVRAAVLHFQLAHDHPFLDGNGRVARALFYWYMLRKGYRLVRFVSLSGEIRRARGQYDRAFLLAEQTGDLTYFVIYHLKVVRRLFDGLSASLQRRLSELRQAEVRLRDWPGLNLRQQLIVKSALKDPDAEVTANAVIRLYGVARATALHDLAGLASAGLFEGVRVGKELVYRPAADLAVRVEAPGRAAAARRTHP